MITQSELKELLHYNPDAGIFEWRKTRPGVKAGSCAGYNIRGYVSIEINNIPYFAHRLAWLYAHGVWPKEQIDHINHIKNDNRLSNLREVSSFINHQNQKLNKNNKSGVCGVYWCNERGSWNAVIKVFYKRIFLGRFTDKFEAICARLSANNKYGFHENHGK